MNFVRRHVTAAGHQRWHYYMIPAFGMLLIAILWTTVFVGLAESEQKTVANELRATESYVAAFETHARRILRESDRTLLLLKAEVERTATINLARMRSLGLIRGDDVSGISVVDRHGVVVASSRDVDAARNVADVKYFQDLAGVDTGAMYISHPFKGRLVGEDVVVLARRVNEIDGSFAGAVVVAVRASVFTEFYQESDLGQRGVLGMLGLDGFYRARRQGAGNSDVSATANPAMIKRVLQRPVASLVSTSPFDDVVRLVAYRRLADFPIVVIAAQSRDEALADFYAHRRNYLALAVAVTLAMLPFFAFLMIVMQRLHGRTEQLANQRGFIGELLDNIPMGISVRRLEPDGSGPYVVWNETNEVIYGVGRDAVLDQAVSATAPEAAAEKVLAWDRELLASPGVQESVEHELLANGIESIVHRVRAPIFNVRNEVEYVITVSEDVTRQSAIEDDLRLASSVFDTTVDGIVISDANDRVIKANGAFTKLAGFTECEIKGQRLYDSPFSPPDPLSYEERTRHLQQDGCRTVEVRRCHKNGSALDLWLSATIVRNGTGAIVNFVRVFTDISQLKDAQSRLEALASIDVLTGLPNRRMFNDRLNSALLRAARTERRMGVLFLDLDGFKRVNDDFGHDAGDKLLKQAAARLARCVRGSDYLCRLGGDEFTVIFENLAQPDHAVFIPKRILEEFSRPFMLGEREVRVGTSIGIATYPENGESAIDLVQSADAAMYRAKRAGGNRFEFHPVAAPVAAAEGGARSGSTESSAPEGSAPILLH